MTGKAVLEGKEAKISARANRLPQYWGGWFARIGDGDMKETNLNIFYHFGAAVQGFYDHISSGTKVLDLWADIFLAQEWLNKFLRETEELKFALRDSREAAGGFLVQIQYLIDEMRSDTDRVLKQQEVSGLIGCKDQLETAFEREYRNLSVFTVTPKGLYDTRLLIEDPQQAFAEKIRRFLPQQMLEDFKQAARCLAFEIPTACAFHVCRGTEALIIQYHEKLSGHPWTEKRKDWGIYTDHLVKDGAPEKITTRLREIAKMDRNAYIHPDINVTLEESPTLFNLCAGVIFNIGQELERLTP